MEDCKYSRTIELLKRNMSVELTTALNDPKTVEVMLNPDSSLWVEKLGQKPEKIGFYEKTRAMAFMETISAYHNKELTASKPILECELPLDGSRFSGLISPVVIGPTFTIRKKAISIFTLSQYVENGVMTKEQKECIENAIRAHRNILVIGGTGSGKTTLVNAIIDEMVQQNPTERPVIIEDTGEIQCSAKNSVQLHTSLEVSMTDLLKTTLRMRPDRILVGEVRGPEALDLLMAWNTGHPGGSATLHANDAKAGLDRLETLISMNKNAPKFIRPLIAEAVNLVVCIARTSNGRTIKEIIEVKGFDNENNSYITVTL
ncbi:MAG: P-type conjugative transfer ATPase TrbB [Ruminobacter sp.]|nr:P-type conjugative transfer ATPase TrbB [Ruminobacter sp.]